MVDKFPNGIFVKYRLLRHRALEWFFIGVTKPAVTRIVILNNLCYNHLWTHIDWIFQNIMKKPRKTKTQKYIQNTFKYSLFFNLLCLILARGCAWDLATILTGIGFVAIVRAIYIFFRYSRCPECNTLITQWSETNNRCPFCGEKIE